MINSNLFIKHIYMESHQYICKKYRMLDDVYTTQFNYILWSLNRTQNILKVQNIKVKFETIEHDMIFLVFAYSRNSILIIEKRGGIWEVNINCLIKIL